MRNGRLRKALRTAGVIIVCQSEDLAIAWAENLPAAWRARGAPRSDRDLFPTDLAERMMAAKRRVLASGASETIEFQDGLDRDGRWYEAVVEREGAPGAGAEILSTVTDVTERKHREQTLRTLLREVSHRSKNLLAVILSIATQTERHSVTREGFLRRFRGRVHSLASSQDLITSSNWRGAMLSELVAGQVAKYSDDGARTVRFSGADPYLTPNAALHVGLALHELVVNSVSHGALSRPEGHVLVTCRIEGGNGGARSAVLEWNEHTTIDPARERRFGSVALERVVPASVDGEADLSFGQDHLRYRLVMPDDNFEIV